MNPNTSKCIEYLEVLIEDTYYDINVVYCYGPDKTYIDASESECELTDTTCIICFSYGDIHHDLETIKEVLRESV